MSLIVLSFSSADAKVPPLGNRVTLADIRYRSPAHRDTVHVQVRDTYLLIRKDHDGRTMSMMQISQLLQRASTDIEDKIAQYGGGGPLLGDYIYYAGDLVVEAWQFRSEVEYRVTYNVVLDMVTGLQNNIGRLDDVECGISLSPMIGKLPRAAGAGVLRFADGSAKFGSNGTNSGFSNAASQTTASLGALDRYQFSIRDGETYMTARKTVSYRRMPDLMVDTVLYKVYQDMELQIAHHGGNTPLSDDYEYSRGGLTLAVWQNKSSEETQYEITYQTVRNMVTGLRAGLWHIENIECALDVERVADGRNLEIGHGSLMFQAGFSQIRSNTANIPSTDNGYNRTAILEVIAISQCRVRLGLRALSYSVVCNRS